MPPVVIAGGIAAAASLAGSAMASRSAGKATKAQSDANNQALAFQKEQDAKGRADWTRAMQAWETNRNALLQRYGISIPQAQAQAPYQRVANQAPMGPGAVPQPMPGGPGQPSPQDPTMLARSPMPGRGGPQLPYQMQDPRVNLEALLRGGYTGAPNRYGMR